MIDSIFDILGFMFWILAGVLTILAITILIVIFIDDWRSKR